MRVFVLYMRISSEATVLVTGGVFESDLSSVPSEKRPSVTPHRKFRELENKKRQAGAWRS